MKKKDGSWRVWVDSRRLNAVTVKDAYPIPKIEDYLVALAGSQWFSTLDLNMACHRVPMAEQDKKKTDFATPRGGLFQYTIMPVGLCNAPVTFQRIIEKTLSGLQWKIAVLYLDDIVVFGKNLEEHISNLEKIFDRLDEMNLKVKAQKCSFFKTEVQFLRYVVTTSGIKTAPVKTEAIRNAARATNVSKLRPGKRHSNADSLSRILLN